MAVSRVLPLRKTVSDTFAWLKSAMSDAVGKQVQIRLLDPDAGYTTRHRLPFLPPIEWPLVRGQLVKAIQGLYGYTWYLVELDNALPVGFDPLENLPEQFHRDPIRYLLVSTGAEKIERPPDVIAEGLVKGGTVDVLVSIGIASNMMPRVITQDIKSQFPYLCSGELKALGA